MIIYVFSMRNLKMPIVQLPVSFRMSGDKVIGCDAYAGNNLFYGELQPLLHGYIEEAIGTGSTPVIKDDKVKEYLNPILSSEATQEAHLKKMARCINTRRK